MRYVLWRQRKSQAIRFDWSYLSEMEELQVPTRTPPVRPPIARGNGRRAPPPVRPYRWGRSLLRRALGRRRKTPRIDESFEKMDGSLYKKFWASHQVGHLGARDVRVAPRGLQLLLERLELSLLAVDDLMQSGDLRARGLQLALLARGPQLACIAPALRPAIAGEEAWRHDKSPCACIMVQRRTQ